MCSAGRLASSDIGLVGVFRGCSGLLRDLARRYGEFPAIGVTWASPDMFSGSWIEVLVGNGRVHSLRPGDVISCIKCVFIQLCVYSVGNKPLAGK